MKNESPDLWDICPVCGVHRKQKSRAMCFGCETKRKAEARREKRKEELNAKISVYAPLRAAKMHGTSERDKRIIEALRSGSTEAELARFYGVTRQRIEQIVTGGAASRRQLQKVMEVEASEA